jgi:Cu/Ag efflux pump CusA
VVQFALERIEEGESLHQACVDAGALRAMPIFLTAAAVFVGGLVILLDPIFNGLATSIIWGTGASTLLSLVMVPVYLYNHLRKEEGRNKKRAFKEAKKRAKLQRAAKARDAGSPPSPPTDEGPVSA